MMIIVSEKLKKHQRGSGKGIKELGLGGISKNGVGLVIGAI